MIENENFNNIYINSIKKLIIIINLTKILNE
jgi:hypothetical protein